MRLPPANTPVGVALPSGHDSRRTVLATIHPRPILLATQTQMTNDDKKEITIFLCGPKKCEHEFTLDAPIVENGKVVGGTAVCAKCGARAIDESMWW